MFKKLLILLFPVSVMAQTEIPLNDLSAFKNPSANWSIEGDASGNPNSSVITPKAGKGVLLCTLKGAKYQRTDDLRFNLEHGDIRLSLDFIIPKGSNSGIYLQGRYEVQIFDSWLKKVPGDGDCGAIYHRWDETRGKGKEGYEGHAPLQNACKAPGLWNHIDIDFKAPTFDASGKKITNARFNKVVLNGVTIHENIELLGVTRGAIFPEEGTKGPILIQGDHGQVAFKNIRYEVFDKPLATFSPVTFDYFEGKLADLKTDKLKPVKSGKSDKPTMKLAEAKSDFLIRFQGKITASEADNYLFTTNWTGTGALIVDGDTITKGSHWYSESVKGSKNLSAGEHTYTLIYAKDFSWGPKGLGLFIERVGSWKQNITERTSLPEPEPTPLVEVKVSDETMLQRSFVMFGKKKITHAINVGMPNGLNFSYNLNQGGFLQIWRGAFLDATEMWYERGEPQIGQAMGAAVTMNNKFPLVYAMDNNGVFPDSSADLQYKGYRLEKKTAPNGNVASYPVFMYAYKGVNVKDQETPLDSGEGIKRQLSVEGESTGKLYALLAEGSKIEDAGGNRFNVDGQIYVQTFPSETNKPFIRDNNGRKQLVTLVEGKEITYHLIF